MRSPTPAPRPVTVLPTPPPPPDPQPPAAGATDTGDCAPVVVLWLSIADLAVQHALSFYGRRVLLRGGRSMRNHDGHLKQLDTVHWYRHLPPSTSESVQEILTGSLVYFDQAAAIADPDKAACIREVLLVYLRTVIVNRIQHDRAKLRRALETAGCLEVCAAA